MRGQFLLNSTSQSSQRVEPIPFWQNRVNLQPEVFRFPLRKFWKLTMAKVGILGILFAIILLIILGILGESFSNAQKPKLKVVVKRRKVVTTTTTTDLPALEDFPLDELVEGGQPQVPALESNLELISVTTGSSILHTPQDRTTEVQSGSISIGPGVILTQNDTGMTTGKPIGVPGGCPLTCEKENCPLIDCPIGLVMDRCSCCLACAVGEGSRCYNSTNPIATIGPDDGICGPGLLCVERMDLGPEEPLEALCQCRNSESVCGSDNVTYSSECKLREASHYERNLTLASWRPCVSAPWITTPMENVTGAIGKDVSMSCEFRSFPASVIHWEFSPDDTSKRTVLPGDDSSIIQTNRGGPEEMMTTSWIQIVSITPRRQGTYYCFAKNTEGMSQSYASLSVYSEIKNNSNHSTPFLSP